MFKYSSFENSLICNLQCRIDVKKMKKFLILTCGIIIFLLICENIATPVFPPRRVKRSLRFCESNIMGCFLLLKQIIPFRLHLDVIKFLDKHVTGRQDFIEERKIEAFNVEHNKVSENLDQVHEIYELKKEYHEANQKLVSAKTNYWRKLHNNEPLKEIHKSWLEKYTNQLDYDDDDVQSAL